MNEATTRDLLRVILERLDYLAEKLELIHNGVHRLETKQETIMEDLSRLTTEVSETATVIDSAVALIAGLSEQIRNLPANQAAIDALADSLDAKANELAAAVANNTTPAPAPEPPPEEPV